MPASPDKDLWATYDWPGGYTGSIDKRDNTPVSLNTRLGYGMQNGSGTFDPFLLLNNVNSLGKFKLGEQIFLKLPLSAKNTRIFKILIAN